MTFAALAFGLSTGVIVTSIVPAVATPHHRHPSTSFTRHHYAPRHQAEPIDGYGYSAGPYGGYDDPGSIIAEATARAQREPGVTLELAPDAKQTATGGPVGGVPGFSGF